MRRAFGPAEPMLLPTDNCGGVPAVGAWRIPHQKRPLRGLHLRQFGAPDGRNSAIPSIHHWFVQVAREINEPFHGPHTGDGCAVVENNSKHLLAYVEQVAAARDPD